MHQNAAVGRGAGPTRCFCFVLSFLILFIYFIYFWREATRVEGEYGKTGKWGIGVHDVEYPKIQ